MNKEEILYNEIYERTKDFGRTHFIKEIMRLQIEIKELKEQYNDLVEEKEKLQEQLSINTLQLEEMKLSKRDYTQENILTMKLTLKENQQKEFIEYLENEIKERKIQILGYHPNTQLLIEQIIETEKMVLSKYNEIIGGKE